MKKKIASRLLLVTSCLVAPAYAIDFWHSNTVWAGQGQCSAVFTFDSGLEDIKKLQVLVSATNRSGKRVAAGVLEVPQFGQSSATRYAEAYLEGEDLCEDNLTIRVTKASAMIDGKRTDLLNSRILTARKFHPYEIYISK
jgi:interleukin receptor mimic protein A